MDSKQRIHVMTLANSIIGVSILAMPFCFKQCGIILSILLLFFSSILCRLACHFLLKSAIKARLRTFEFLAYHVFGSVGKLFVEIGIIGFLLGTCVAFFVVMGDLGPQIIAQLTETKSMETLRTTILVAIGLLCVLPLGLLRNVDSLSSVCIATIGFYGILALKIFLESAPHLFTGNWYDNVDLWRPTGILQCIPIFSMALFCQTQLFEIYQAIPNASLDKMNEVVKVAVNICTSVYIFVGVFGYIAVSHKPTASGNILMDFEPSIITETMKIGFVLSVACSFPLVIFPCRASLYSLLYRPTYTGLHDSTSLYIPEGKFRLLTLLIVTISLIIGVLIPNIELVLGLVGSTIGIMICVIFPATCFICLTERNTNERILAQLMLFIGISVMVLGTYANLYAIDHIELNKSDKLEPKGLGLQIIIKDSNLQQMQNIDKIEGLQSMRSVEKEIQIKIPDAVKEVRHEPPQPEEPVESPKVQGIPKDMIKLEESVQEKLKLEDLPYLKKAVEPEIEIKEVRHEPPQPEAPIELEKPDNSIKIDDNRNENVVKAAEIPLKKKETTAQDSILLPVGNVDIVANTQREDTDLNKIKEVSKKQLEQGSLDVDIEAIAKEDKELEEAKGPEAKANLVEHKKLVEQEQRLYEKNKKLLKEIKLIQEEQQVNAEKVKAVKNIQNIAQKAIDLIIDDKLKESQILSKVETLSNIVDVKNILKKNEEFKINDKKGHDKVEIENVENKILENSSTIQNNQHLKSAPLSYQLGLHQNQNVSLLNKTQIDSDAIKTWTLALKSAVSEVSLVLKNNDKEQYNIPMSQSNDINITNTNKANYARIADIVSVKLGTNDRESINVKNNASIPNFIRLSDKKPIEHEIEEIKQALDVKILKKLPKKTPLYPKKDTNIDGHIDKQRKNTDNSVINENNGKVEKTESEIKQSEIKQGKNANERRQQSENNKKNEENLEMRRDILAHDYDLNKI